MSSKKIALKVKEIKEKIRVLRKELINSLDSYEDEKNPHTPTKEEIKHLERIFKQMIEFYGDVKDIKGEISDDILKETSQIAKGIRMYDPYFIYIHKDIVYHMVNLPPGVLV